MNARHQQRPVNRVIARWASVGAAGGRDVEFLEYTLDRITEEHCARCGCAGTVWDGGDDARLCTRCGTQYRFEQLPEAATDPVILGCIRKAAGEMPTAQR